MWQSFSSVSAISSNGSSRFCLNFSCAGHVVARHAEDHRAGLQEVLVLVAELHRFGCAAGRVVLRVEVQHDRLAQMGLGRELHATGGQGFEFGEGLVDDRRHG
jgi:hypothetical protein